MWSRLRDRFRDPIFYNDALQLFKTALAAVLAWVVAASVLDLPQPFLAPWAALLVVHATVFRTFSQGAQQVLAAVVGVLVASAVGHLLGPGTTAVAMAMLLGLVIGSLKWFGAETTTIAATALVVLTTGFNDDSMLWSRLVDTGIGVLVGLLVNAVVWPPLRRRTALIAMDRIDDRIGELLGEMGQTLAERCEDDDVTSWIEQTRHSTASWMKPGHWCVRPAKVHG